MKYICARSNKRPFCGTGLKTILIDSDGEVYPCPNHAKPEFSCGNISEMRFEEIMLDSPVIRKIRKLYHIDSINDECPECPVKYWCLGGCRGETYENTGILTAQGTGCEEMRKAIIETFWILADGESVEETKTEYF
jgi:radical SAM protein with 4Fe4S-binding SPASM domain